jgi:hypothetical protein
MKYDIEWAVSGDKLGWYLEWWYRGEYWTNKHHTRLKSTKFENAVCEARQILNLD